MSELLKLMYNEKLLCRFGHKVQKVYADFDLKGFIDKLIDSEWVEIELKGRMRKITQVLGRFLPASYEEALNMVLSLQNGNGHKAADMIVEIISSE